jgi:nitroreductase
MSDTQTVIHTEAVDAAITTRRSVRAFLPTPVREPIHRPGK